MSENELDSFENLRLENLRSYRISDIEPKELLENIIQLAAHICEVPISSLSFVNSQSVSLQISMGEIQKEIPREGSFCSLAIENEEPLCVNNASFDSRFSPSRLSSLHTITHYTGVPIISPEGFTLGCLNVMDVQNRNLSTQQMAGLKCLAKTIMSILEHERLKAQFKEYNSHLSQKMDELEEFSIRAAHDLRSPLMNIINLADLLKNETALNFQDSAYALSQIQISARQLNEMVSGILTCSQIFSCNELTHISTDLEEIRTLIELIGKEHTQAEVSWNTSISKIIAPEGVVPSILLNLVSNALRHNDKQKPRVEVDLSEDAENYILSVSDNGPGIKKKHHKDIFTFLKSLPSSGEKKVGYGIGLATVKKLVESCSGTIDLRSSPGQGSIFTVHIPKKRMA